MITPLYLVIQRLVYQVGWTIKIQQSKGRAIAAILKIDSGS
jgi:hypothetical protein